MSKINIEAYKKERRKQIGLKIQELRTSNYVSLEDICSKMGISTSTLRRVENGTSEFSISEIEILSLILNTTVFEILDYEFNFIPKSIDINSF